MQQPEMLLRVAGLIMGVVSLFWVVRAGVPLVLSYVLDAETSGRQSTQTGTGKPLGNQLARKLGWLCGANLFLISIVSRTDPFLTVTLPVTTFLMVAAFVDYYVQKLPDKVTILAGLSLLAGLGVRLLLVPAPAPGRLLLSAAFGAGLWALTFAVIHYGFKGMGKGDLKLAPVIGGWLGLYSYQTAYAGLTLAAILGGLVAGILVLTKRLSLQSVIPFGPFMVAGAWLAWAAAVTA